LWIFPNGYNTHDHISNCLYGKLEVTQ
jgi:hypothetical protein